MDKMIITYRGTVYNWQCDHMGHMNVMFYTGKFDEATWQMFAAIGITPSHMQTQGRGVVAVKQNITYRRELTAGALITIRTGILKINDKSIRFYHEMWNDETMALSATTVILGLYFDLQLRKSVPFPEEIIRKGQELIIEKEPVI